MGKKGRKSGGMQKLLQAAMLITNVHLGLLRRIVTFLIIAPYKYSYLQCLANELP